jgi:hypothetical protein
VNFDAAQALIELASYIEDRFPCVVDMTHNESAVRFVSVWKPQFAPTGETYVEFTPHRTPEGGLRADYRSAQEVIAAAKDQFDAYAADKPEGSTVYWRIKPEIDCLKAGKNAGCWMFYMRLLISDKPPQTKES